MNDPPKMAGGVDASYMKSTILITTLTVDIGGTLSLNEEVSC